MWSLLSLCVSSSFNSGYRRRLRTYAMTTTTAKTATAPIRASNPTDGPSSGSGAAVGVGVAVGGSGVGVGVGSGAGVAVGEGVGVGVGLYQDLPQKDALQYAGKRATPSQIDGSQQFRQHGQLNELDIGEPLAGPGHGAG